MKLETRIGCSMHRDDPAEDQSTDGLHSLIQGAVDQRQKGRSILRAETAMSHPASHQRPSTTSPTSYTINQRHSGSVPLPLKFHALLAKIKFPSERRLKSWMKSLPDPSNPPAYHIHTSFLLLRGDESPGGRFDSNLFSRCTAEVGDPREF